MSALTVTYALLFYAAAAILVAGVAARIALGFAGVGLSDPVPEYPTKRVTAAGFDGGVAILSSVEPGSQSDVKRNRGGERLRRRFEESRIHDDWKIKSGKYRNIRIDDNGDSIRFLPPFELIQINQRRPHPFDCVTAIVHRF